MTIDTKGRITDAAERLFADHGFPATSMRDITHEAGVNLAAVNYHFGSKEALLIAVIERTIMPVNHARLERLEALEADAGEAPVPTEQLVRAFLTPIFEKSREPDPKFLKLIGRLHAEGNQELRAKFNKRFEPVFRRFSAAFHRGLPGLDIVDVHLRVQFLVGSMAYTMTWGREIIAAGTARPTPDTILEALIQFAVAGMAAPVPRPVAVRNSRRVG
jgi:AcrR family transcriptional regulator